MKRNLKLKKKEKKETLFLKIHEIMLKLRLGVTHVNTEKCQSAAGCKCLLIRLNRKSERFGFLCYKICFL